MGSKTPPKGEQAAVHDTAKPDDGKHYGLKLTLGGAPNTLHIVPGLGYVRVDPPAPVGGPGEPTLERAVEASKDDGCAVELVELPDKQAAAARAAMQQSLHDVNRALGIARREDDDMPQDRLDDETAALTGAAQED